MADWNWIQVIYTLGIFGMAMTIVPGCVMGERWISAWLQRRRGPIMVGIPIPGITKNFTPGGLAIGQPLADAFKFIFKEDFVPATAERWLYRAAPILVFLPSALALSAIPFAPSLINGEKVVIFDSEIGLLFALAATSLGVHGLTLAGWSSNNKFSQMGGVRASAQLISYEAPMFIATLCALLLLGTTNLTTMVEEQAENGWLIARAPLAFAIFYICTFAETNRHPFDMPEAEPELVGGYHTEYGGMRFALFFLGEYIAMINQCAICVLLFLGGWNIPFFDSWDQIPFIRDFNWNWDFFGWFTLNVNGLVAFLVFVGKVSLLLLIMIWVRWSLPRFRYDQLMWLGWKRLTPFAMINLVVYVIAYVVVPQEVWEQIGDFLGYLI